jgi:hypothetical protein
MTTVFLFGAGASSGSGACRSKPPPLGRDLFAALRAEGGVAATFPDDLALAFRDFEAGMALLYEERNQDLVPFLLQMARYFVQFYPVPGNHYIELVAMLKRLYVRPVFVTLNYEMMLEHAIQANGFLPYHGLTAKPPRWHVRVLKIHGSCHFLPDTDGANYQWENCTFESDTGGIFEGKVLPARTSDEVYAFLARQTMLAPAMAMYAKGKRVLHCPDFIKQLTASWQEVSKDTKRIIIIGVAVNEEDKHIWGTLADSTAPLYYVGGRKSDGDTFLAWAKRKNRRNVHVLADSFEAALPKIAGLVSR